MVQCKYNDVAVQKRFHIFAYVNGIGSIKKWNENFVAFK